MPNAGTPPYFGQDKFGLVKACTLSFLQTGGCNRLYILDNCPPEYKKWFTKYGQGEVTEGVWGKKGSLYAAYDFARRRVNGDDTLLFLEDDYLWRPNTLGDLDTAIRHFGLATPYDHAGHYTGHGECMQTYLCGNLTWRWCRTTTHTFGVTTRIFNDAIDDFYYGLHDWQMFTKLDIDGHRVYSPLYSMATHLVDGLLAYNTNWEDLANWYKQKVKELK
jgi:hypothetical protein